MANEALVTNVWRKKRLLSDSDICPVCGAEAESILHLIHDCNRMKQVWTKLADGSFPHVPFFVEDIHSWLRVNLISSETRWGINWSLIFGSVILLAWQARN